MSCNNHNVKVFQAKNGGKWIKDNDGGNHIFIDKKGKVAVFDNKKKKK
jgi:hypothetical protein